jgi:hypothetical protein
VEYLSHFISEAGVCPLENKTTVIKSFPQPTTVKELEGFLEMVKFYHHFLPSVAKTKYC